MAEPQESPEGAPRRTHLAAERTQLAWWRTGLTAIAVGVGVGRVVPELAGTTDTLPYVVTGVAFALYGVVLIAYGTLRARELERKLGGRHEIDASDAILLAITGFGILLGLASVALIAIE
ncbi:MAG: YidH family protein [Solirubrobacterales bacterium]